LASSNISLSFFIIGICASICGAYLSTSQLWQESCPHGRRYGQRVSMRFRILLCASLRIVQLLFLTSEKDLKSFGKNALKNQFFFRLSTIPNGTSLAAFVNRIGMAETKKQRRKKDNGNTLANHFS